MLRWRLLLGILIIAALLALCWLDYRLYQITGIGQHVEGIRGIALLPVLLVFVVLASREVLHLAAAGGMRPVPWVVYSANVLMVISCWIAPLCWRFGIHVPPDSLSFALVSSAAAADATLIALAAGVMIAFAAEMYRFKTPGGVTVNVAAAVFAMVYVGLLLSFLVRLLLQWGLFALLSLLIVVKMGDTGAYTVGRLVGRNKMAPDLSPGKTIEGAIGAMLFACAASWLTFYRLLPGTEAQSPPTGPSWGWLPFGLLVAFAGMIGDLAESLIKRDVERKDSSSWMPGFGGVLDVLDSVLLAAPVAYACWAWGLVR